MSVLWPYAMVVSPAGVVLVLWLAFRVRAAWRSLTYTGWYEVKR